MKFTPILFTTSLALCVLCVTGCAGIELLPNVWMSSTRARDYFDSPLQAALAEASGSGDTNRIRLLINQGADVNCVGRYGMRPLFWALVKCNIKGVTFLLDHGADPDVKGGDRPYTTSPLYLAAGMKDPEYLEELLKHGANPNGTSGNTDETAIFAAGSLYRTNNIAILLKHGADINWKTTGGETPMEDAIDGGVFRTALFLYHAGANPLIKDKWGYSSIDTLSRFGDRGYVSRVDKVAYKELIKELTENGLLDRYDLK